MITRQMVAEAVGTFFLVFFAVFLHPRDTDHGDQTLDPHGSGAYLS